MMPETYQVVAGDCLSSIAAIHGHFWETLWNHAENGALKSRRKDPNVLLPGDTVFIPDRRVREADKADSKRHRFRRKGVPARFKLQVLLDDQPQSGKKYELEVDGRVLKGSLDGQGMLDVALPPGARRGELRVGDGSEMEVFELEFGQIDPIDTDSGVAGRLADLGYSVEPDLAEGVREFQTKNGLSVTGVVDQATRDKLKKAFGL